jgi:hypothetical protein
MKHPLAHPAPTVSQQFLRDIGHQEPVSAGEALAWHYRALLRRREFERSQAGVHALPPTAEDRARLDREDREEVLADLGIPSGEGAEFNPDPVIPGPVDALLWKWVL